MIKIIDYRGKSVPKAKSGIPLITARNIRQGFLDFTNQEYLDEKKYDEWMTRGIPMNGDILFTTEAPLGCVCRYPKEGKYAIGQRTITLRANTKTLSPDFLLYFFLSKHGQRTIDFQSTGSTAKGIKSSKLKKLEITFPSDLAEQYRIVAVIEKWEEAIMNLEKKIDLKKNLQNKLMQSLLNGAARLPGFHEEWKTVKLSDIFERIKRTTKNTDSIKSYSISSKIGFETQEVKYSRVMSGSSLKKYTHLLKGEFSYNKGNSLTYPYGCVYVFEDAEGLVPFVYISFKNKGKVDSDFYKQYFLHGFLEKQLKALITSGVRGNGLLNISAKDFFQCTVLCPPIKEQTAIAKTLTAADKEINLLEKKVAGLKEQKAYLLNNLITGRIRTPENMPIPKS